MATSLIQISGHQAIDILLNSTNQPIPSIQFASIIQGVAALTIAATGVNAYNTIYEVQHTFYGYPDNSPPGATIAYDCGRGYTAGGQGTYDDPRTFATAPGEFDKCEIIWDPYTQKYLIFEDTCEQCISDWDSSKYHIDIWTGSSSTDGGEDQVSCEDELTPDRGHSVIRHGTSDHTVNTGPLYTNGVCHTENVYPNNN